jgi:predicted nuclease with TOPRIM domain
MADEIKPAGNEGQPPAGGTPPTPPPANQGPSVEELQKQNKELQDQMKERDTKIADLETTKATIETRQRQIDEAKIKQTTDETLKQRISQINERRAYDPDGADAEMANLLSEVRTQTAQDAVRQAQVIITQQTTLEKIRMGVKSSNPDFDDDVVEVIMQRANILASTGKYKTADEAVKAATDFVKQKFEGDRKSVV